jgi:hypothetical protein
MPAEAEDQSRAFLKGRQSEHTGLAVGDVEDEEAKVYKQEKERPECIENPDRQGGDFVAGQTQVHVHDTKDNQRPAEDPVQQIGEQRSVLTARVNLRNNVRRAQWSEGIP